MTAKEYLRQLKTIDNRINAKLLEKERVRTLGGRVTTGLSERIQGGGGKDKVCDVVIKLTELENDTVNEINKLVDLKREASELIEKMADIKCKTVLSMYYLSNKTFEEVADYTEMSSRWVRIIHGRALQKFQKIFQNSSS